MRTRQTLLVALSLLCGLLFAGEEPHQLNYIQNKGQWAKELLFRSDFRGGRVFLHKNSFTYLFYPTEGFTRLHPHPGGKQESDAFTFDFHVVKMEFEGSQDAIVQGGDKKDYYNNYFLGNDPKKWASKVPIFSSVNYHELYPGISLKALGDANNMRYDFMIAPHADISKIKLKFTGADGLEIKDGHLYIKTKVGGILQKAPFAYQEVNGEKRQVRCEYRLKEGRVAFAIVGDYDKERPLTIDPTLVFSTYTGSTADNWGMSATYDMKGNGYTSGIGFDVGYPTTTGAFQASWAGGGTGGGNVWPWPDSSGFDIVVSKFNPSGSNLLYSTYLGGSDNEEPESIIVDNAGNLLVLGRSYSVDFPVTTGAYDVSQNGNADIIISKFDSMGTALLASTYIGGSADDGVNYSSIEGTIGSIKHNYADDGRGDIILDNSNNVYVASCTNSTNFPTTSGCYQNTNRGLQDGCAFKMNANLSTLTWSTYLGGSKNDAAYNLALDQSNAVYVTGGSESSDFPTTTGALHSAYMGSIDGFLTHISASGTSLLQSTYIGTSAYDQSYFVQLDNYENVYIYGQSEGGYPITPNVYSNANSGQFIHAFTPNLVSTIFSTEFGSGRGTCDIVPSAFLVDECQNIYISGWGGSLFGYNNATSSTDGMPLTANAFQSTTDGMDFYFLVLQKNASALWYATYFGGTSGSEEHVDGGTSRFDKSGVIYQAICESCGAFQDMPTTPGAWSSTNNSPNCNNALVKFSFDLVITLTSFNIIPAINTGCVPFTATFENTTTNATSYFWDFGDGTTSTQANPSHTYITPGDYTVSLIGKDTNTCNQADTAHAYVHVHSTPTVNIPAVAPVCPSQTVQIQASSNVQNLTWTPSAGLSNSSVLNPIASPTATTQYILTVTDSFCGSISDTVLITVNNPQVPVIAGATQFCSNDSASLSATPAGFTSYQWSTGTTAPTTWVYGAGIYSLTTHDANGCVASDTIQIATIPVPIGTYSVNTSVGCVPLSTQFNFTGSGTDNYYWSFGDGANSTLASPAHTYTNSGTYTVTLVVTNTTVCNFPDTARSVVVVHPLPVISITPPPPYCVGDTVQLNAFSPTAISYTWTPASGLSSTSIANPMASPLATTVYTLNVSNGTCQKSDTVTVHVFPPNVTTITTTGQICAGDTVTLTAQGPGISWQWATGQTTQSIEVNQAGSYMVNTLDVNNCKGSSSIDIFVFQPVTLSTQNTIICEGQLAHIEVKTTPQGNYQYSWDPGASLNNQYGYNPIANPTVTTMYTVTVSNGPCVSSDTLKVTVVPLPIIHITSPHYIETFFGEGVEMIAVSNFPVTWVPYDYLSCVTCYTTIATPEQNMTYHAVSVNELGCAAEDTVRIELTSTFFAPNTFTPEGDELNEVWKPVFSGYVQMDVYIYDRWGNQVIHWSDLNGGWDGTFRGKPAQEDVYVYKVIALDFQHKEFHKSGTINLVR